MLAEVDGPPDFTVELVGLDALDCDSNGRAEVLVDFEEGKNNGIYRSHPDGSERQHIISVSKIVVFSSGK